MALLFCRLCVEPRDDEATEGADVALQSQEGVVGETLNDELTESREGLSIEGEVAADGAEFTA